MNNNSLRLVCQRISLEWPAVCMLMARRPRVSSLTGYQTMLYPEAPHCVQPCLWMSAGLLTYKLCDRGFDCDRCPLDAALRAAPPGSPRRETLLLPSRNSEVFPEDRLYTIGHLWVQVIGRKEDRLVRFGLDAFAATIIGRCCEVTWRVSERTLERGEAICQIDVGLGILSVGMPFCGVVVDGNRDLVSEPNRLVTAPYEDGWLVDLVATDLTELHRLLTASAARKTARLDLQRLRRRIALQMLAEAGKVGRTLADGGEPLTDLRQVLGGSTYLDILRELIH
jgi:glycine cleavage system H protein